MTAARVTRDGELGKNRRGWNVIRASGHVETDERQVHLAVIDDHPITRAGLVAHLREAGLTVVGEIGAVELFEELRPQPEIAVCDLHLPGRSGAEAIAYLNGLGCVVLATSGVARAEEVLDAIAAGAYGFLAKTAPPLAFARAVAALARGMYYISPELASYLLNDVRIRPLPQGEIGAKAVEMLRALERGETLAEAAVALGLSLDATTGLVSQVWEAERRRRRRYMPSPRERDVMILVAQGLSHKEVSMRLWITPACLAEILEHIRDKYITIHPDAPPSLAPLAAARLWAAELALL